MIEWIETWFVLWTLKPDTETFQNCTKRWFIVSSQFHRDSLLNNFRWIKKFFCCIIFEVFDVDIKRFDIFRFTSDKSLSTLKQVFLLHKYDVSVVLHYLPILIPIIYLPIHFNSFINHIELRVETIRGYLSFSMISLFLIGFYSVICLKRRVFIIISFMMS